MLLPLWPKSTDTASIGTPEISNSTLGVSLKRWPYPFSISANLKSFHSDRCQVPMAVCRVEFPVQKKYLSLNRGTVRSASATNSGRTQYTGQPVFFCVYRKSLFPLSISVRRLTASPILIPEKRSSRHRGSSLAYWTPVYPSLPNTCLRYRLRASNT